MGPPFKTFEIQQPISFNIKLIYLFVSYGKQFNYQAFHNAWLLSILFLITKETKKTLSNKNGYFYLTGHHTLKSLNIQYRFTTRYIFFAEIDLSNFFVFANIFTLMRLQIK